MRYLLPAILKLSTANEGGYSNHPKDPGGPTNHGITQATLSAYLKRPASIAEVKALTLATANLIYEANYWTPIRGNDLPAGLDYAVFDFCINSGPHRAIVELQKLLPGVAPDGVIGEKTLTAIAQADIKQLIVRYNTARLAFCGKLRNWASFGRGWTYRIVGVDPKGQYKNKPGVLGDSLRMMAQQPVSVPSASTIAAQPAVGKARDSEVKALAIPGNKMQGGIIGAVSVGSLVQGATTYLPSFTSAQGFLEPYKETAKVIGWVFIGLTVAIAVMTILQSIDKARGPGTHA